MKNPLSLEKTGHDLFEKHDKDTIKTVCVECGGKGFYLLMQGFPDLKNPRNIVGKGEVIPCGCEDGFKYSKELKEYGKKE